MDNGRPITVCFSQKNLFINLVQFSNGFISCSTQKLFGKNCFKLKVTKWKRHFIICFIISIAVKPNSWKNKSPLFNTTDELFVQILWKYSDLDVETESSVFSAFMDLLGTSFWLWRHRHVNSWSLTITDYFFSHLFTQKTFKIVKIKKWKSIDCYCFGDKRRWSLRGHWIYQKDRIVLFSLNSCFIWLRLIKIQMGTHCVYYTRNGFNWMTQIIPKGYSLPFPSTAFVYYIDSVPFFSFK